MDLITTLILVIVSLIIGFMLSSLVQSLRGGREEGQTPELLDSSRYGEIARLWRDRSKENLLVEIEGEIYQSIDDLSENHQKEMVLAASDLRTWLRIFPKPAQISESSAFTTSIDEESSFPSYSPQIPQSEPDKPSLNPFQVFSRATQETPAQETSSKSIVAQIDAILQQKLEGSAFENRGIRLVELPEEGMVVMVGLDKYKDVENVPNQEIRNLIHAAVEEWEEGESGAGAF
jgi:hypothetical protein